MGHSGNEKKENFSMKKKLTDKLVAGKSLFKPPNWVKLTPDEKKSYVYSWLKRASLGDIDRVILSPKTRKYFELAAKPENLSKDIPTLLVEAGFGPKERKGFTDNVYCFDDLAAKIIIHKIREKIIKENRELSSGLATSDQVLAFFSHAMLNGKIINYDTGETVEINSSSSPSIRLKCAEQLAKVFGLTNVLTNNTHTDVTIRVTPPTMTNEDIAGGLVDIHDMPRDDEDDG